MSGTLHREGRSLTIITAFALVLAFLSPSASARSTDSTRRATTRGDWPRFHFDSANTGFNPYEHVLGPDNVNQLVQKWAVPTVGGASPTPVVAGGIVYVAPVDGIVRALDAATGDMIWSTDTGGSMTGDPPTVAGQHVYATNLSGIVTAMDAASGDVQWAVTIGTSAFFSPSVSKGVVYVSAIRPDAIALVALDSTTGRELWSRGVNGDGVPPVSGGLIYETMSLSCDVVAFNASNGRLWWDYERGCEASITSSVAVSDGIAFAGVDGFAVALNAQTGELSWVRDARGWIYATPVVGNGIVYVASTNFLSARDEHNSGLRWKQHVGGRGTVASPALANGVVYMPSGDRRLNAYDADTGELLWQSHEGTALFQGSPAVSNGMVFTADDDGTVYAFGLP